MGIKEINNPILMVLISFHINKIRLLGSGEKHFVKPKEFF